jgi:nucleotide-binding universal stress UspA family protein
MDKFEHYHLAKYLWACGDDTADIPASYLKWASDRLPDVPPDHPWPLWALNLGKAAPTPRDKARFLEASLRLLRPAPGPTVRAMILMPLAWLAHEGLMDQGQAAREAQDMVEEIQASGLDQEHFAVLFDSPESEILDRVKEYEARLFPFGYR